MEAALMLLMLCTVVSAEGVYTTRIITEPSQGPFRIGQQVQFSCLVEPVPPEPVTYQWRMVEDAYSGSTTQQNFSRGFYEGNLHYCYYYCEVSSNGALVGSVSRIIEVQGYLYTEDSVAQRFSCGESLTMNVNVSDHSFAQISSIAWYHNGSEIASGNKYSIENNTTRLQIRNMVESDAGIYEVKISSISFMSFIGSNDDPYCHMLVLPIMEIVAAHAPVTFTVQEQHVPVYNPASIVTTYYLPDTEDENRIELRNPLPIDSPLLDSSSRVSSYWYWNGTQILSSGQMQGLTLSYNNTATAIGEYVEIVSARLYRSYVLQDHCRGYYYYSTSFLPSRFPIQESFWRIKFSNPPSSVSIDFESPILSGVETTTVECTAVGGEPEDAFNLTLWRNGELLAHTNGSHLSHMTTPYQYGTYSVHNTSILKEKVNFQLLLDSTCEQYQHVDDLYTAIGDILRSLCQACDDIYSSDIVDVELNCSASGRLAYLTAGLVYSTPDGEITANTLINVILQAWLQSEDSPTILVNGNAVGLRKQCLTQLNAITRSSCLEVFASELAVTDDIPEITSAVASTHLVIGFFSGLITGVVISALIIASILCVKKLKIHMVSASESPPKADKSTDIPMGTNQAYESVDGHYQTPAVIRGRNQDTEEAIYELPAV